MWLWRNTLFLLFTAFAAPLEYHVHWLKPFIDGRMPLLDAAVQPLIHGALFFYAVIIAIEAIVRLEMHPQLASSPVLLCLKLFAWTVAVGPFFLFSLKGVDIPLSGLWLTIQWCTALSSFALALIVHAVISRAESLAHA